MLVERYLVFVHSSALRRTGDAAQAAEITRAVFLVLARRARRLRKKTVLAGWLFHVTTVACRKLTRKRFSRLRRLWPVATALAVDFSQARPGVAAGSDPVDASRAPNRSRAGTIANQAAKRGAAVRISESQFCFRGQSSPDE
jgi:DNA-directed RNA polymerase specialized sigma24 family protein